MSHISHYQVLSWTTGCWKVSQSTRRGSRIKGQIVYRIVENFRGRKLSRISVLCLFMEIFCETWRWGVLWCGTSEQSANVFSTKLYFSPLRENFLPQKFPAIWYLLTFFLLPSMITAEVCIVWKMAQDVEMLWKYCSVILLGSQGT